MAKLSLRSVLRRAIEPATLDRHSLAEAYAPDTDGRVAALAELASVRQLGIRLSGLGPRAAVPEQLREGCFAVLVWAEQYETGLADAQHRRGAIARQSLAAAKLFRDTRLQHFGKSKLEAVLETGTAVPLVDILRDKNRLSDG